MSASMVGLRRLGSPACSWAAGLAHFFTLLMPSRFAIPQSTSRFTCLRLIVRVAQD